MSRDQAPSEYEQNRTIHSRFIADLANFRHRYVTPRSDLEL